MSGKSTFGIIMLVFWTIIAVWSLSNIIHDWDEVKIAQENVKKAEQDVAQAKAEYEQTQDNIQAMINEVQVKQ